MRSILQKQMEYEHWANTKLLQAIEQATEVPPRVLDLFGHLLANESIWLSRITETAPVYGMWEINSLDRCAKLIQENLVKWSAYLKEVPEERLNEVIEFDFFEKRSTVVIVDGILHTLGHASYHRGQIVQLLKGKIDPLPLTTFIGYASTEISR